MFQGLTLETADVFDAYGTHDSDLLTQLTRLYCNRDMEPLRGLIAWVNRG